jgi:hypothetical protein
VAVTANDGTRSGVINLNITPIARVWTAGANSNLPDDPANWSLDVVPTQNDTLDIPVVGPLVYPVLNANRSASSLILQNNTAFSLGAFNLTLSKGLTVGTGTTFNASSGQLFLSGTNFTISSASRIPSTRITGRYSLTSNVTVVNRVRVKGGRLQVSGLRLRVEGQ